jgi:hypothetical protein
MRPNLTESKSKSTSIGAIVLLIGPVPVTRHSMEMLNVLQVPVSVDQAINVSFATDSFVAFLMFTAITSKLDRLKRYCTVLSIPPVNDSDSTLSAPRPYMFLKI